jgi:hypothetical protein
VLTFPYADRTWCYDVVPGQWHEWLWIDANGDEHRHRANCFCPVNGTLVVGDWQNGNLYAVDHRVFTDNGSPIKRARSFPHMLADGKRVFYRQFLADFETGNAPPVDVQTTITHTPIWPPLIAALTGQTGTFDMIAAPDWQRWVVYFADDSSYSKYTLALATQPPATPVPATGKLDVLAVDPLSGNLLVQRGLTNGEPILKLDPSTFATIASFGAATSFPSYPGSVWVGQALVCIVCNGVSYALLKEFTSAVPVIRVDTMQQAGFYQAIVTGSTNRGIMCAGASGGSTATAFLTWQALSYTATIPLYVVTITAGAETYNPATWPTTNPHITSATVGTIAASAVDPTQPNLAAFSIGYDLADGNVLMHVGTGTSGAINYFIIKVRASDAAVLWTVPVSVNVSVALDRSRINGSLWVFDNSTSTGNSTRIDTLTGQATVQPLNGVSYGAPGVPATDSENTLAMFFGSFAVRSGSPVAVSGTTSFTNGWALMGGQTTVTTVESLAIPARNLISLRWSDDRGHSWGNPVTQSIGQAGEYLTSLQWQRLAYARDRVFELSWSVPMKTALQGAWIDATPAQS